MNFLTKKVIDYYQDVDRFIQYHQRNILSKSEINKLKNFLRDEEYRVSYEKITDLSLLEVGNSFMIKTIVLGEYPFYRAYVRDKQADGGLYIHCSELGSLEGKSFSLVKSEGIICLNYDYQQPVEVFRRKNNLCFDF